MTLDTLSQQHLDWLEADATKSPNTIAGRRRVLRSLPNAGTATPDDIDDWWQTRTHLSRGTRAVDLAHLHAFYKWLARRGLRLDDPTILLDAPRPENRLHRKIPNEEIRRVLAELSPTMRRALLLGAFAGLRVSESAALDWSDVDSIEDMLLIHDSKGGKSRAVDVSPDLIRRLADEGSTGNVVTAGQPPLTAAQLQQRLNRALKRLDADFTSHDLRHRWGITAYRSTGDLLAVAEMMGHSSVKTTQIYASASSAVKKKIAAAVML